MKKESIKTNVMRILDQNSISYDVLDYLSSNKISGMDVANYLNIDSNLVFKTLVTTGKSHNYYVFLIPVNKELDLKKCALVANEKNVEMIKSKNLLELTGYIHGCCSPIGMKKKFKTFIDKSAENNSIIYFSAGKIGYQIKMNVDDLSKVIIYSFNDLT